MLRIWLRNEGRIRPLRVWALVLLVGALLGMVTTVTAVGTLVEVCPGGGIQPWSADFQPDGIILTTFDKTNIWLFDVGVNRRYPLPDTHPCGTNCRLSRDARWITYINPADLTTSVMHLDGTERTALVNYAADVEWWSADTLLVWTPNHQAYLRPIVGTDQEYLNVAGVHSVQPGGRWGVLTAQDGDNFSRSLINLELRNLPGIAEQRVFLDTPLLYFNADSWSPDGQWLAYASPVMLDGQGVSAEIFGVQPNGDAPIQWTHLADTYGPVRINGATERELNWSPDGTRIAFWVVDLAGTDPAQDSGPAMIHVLNVQTGEVRAYCGFSTQEHTPNPPRLVWSPDGTHLAFGGNIPADDKGYLLLALDTESGIFTEFSDGIFPALGNPDVIAWGVYPG